MEEQKRAGRPLRTFLKVLFLIALVIGLVLISGREWFRLPVLNYYSASEKGFAIPGLADGFVPQGIALDEEDRVFLVGGYMKGSSAASPIYAVNTVTHDVSSKALLTNADGTPFTEHAGGLAISGDNVLVAGNGCVYIFDRDAIVTAGDGGSVPCMGWLNTRLSESDPLRVDFADIAHDDEGDLLTVGEFYREPEYPTAENHQFTAPSGERLPALAVTWRVSEDGGSLVPLRAYALPDQVQGLTFHDGKIWLSTSWGTGFSHILAWDTESLVPFGTVTVSGRYIPLTALEASTRAADYKLPPMAEEIVFSGGKLYTMCESASRKYYFGLLTGGQWCYATDLDKMTSGK